MKIKGWKGAEGLRRAARGGAGAKQKARLFFPSSFGKTRRGWVDVKTVFVFETGVSSNRTLSSLPRFSFQWSSEREPAAAAKKNPKKLPPTLPYKCFYIEAMKWHPLTQHMFYLCGWKLNPWLGFFYDWAPCCLNAVTTALLSQLSQCVAWSHYTRAMSTCHYDRKNVFFAFKHLNIGFFKQVLNWRDNKPAGI